MENLPKELRQEIKAWMPLETGALLNAERLELLPLEFKEFVLHSDRQLDSSPYSADLVRLKKNLSKTALVIIAGSRDPFVPIELWEKQASKIISSEHQKLIRVPGGNHWNILEDKTTSLLMNELDNLIAISDSAKKRCYKQFQLFP